MKRFLQAISLLLVLVVVVVVALYSFGVMPYKVFVMKTGSMSPTIPPRSLVVVREHKYHVGQVISFTVHGEVVTHRLMAIQANSTIITKGDGNATIDPWRVPKSHIIGGVILAPRAIGFFLKALTTLPGLLWLVFFTCFWWLCLSSFEDMKGGSTPKHLVS